MELRGYDSTIKSISANQGLTRSYVSWRCCTAPSRWARETSLGKALNPEKESESSVPPVRAQEPPPARRLGTN